MSLEKRRKLARRHATSLVTECDDGDGTVGVCVGGRRVAAGLAFTEAEDLANDLRREVARAIRTALRESAESGT